MRRRTRLRDEDEMKLHRLGNFRGLVAPLLGLVTLSGCATGHSGSLANRFVRAGEPSVDLGRARRLSRAQHARRHPSQRATHLLLLSAAITLARLLENSNKRLAAALLFEAMVPTAASHLQVAKEYPVAGRVWMRPYDSVSRALQKEPRLAEAHEALGASGATGDCQVKPWPQRIAPPTTIPGQRAHRTRSGHVLEAHRAAGRRATSIPARTCARPEGELGVEQSLLCGFSARQAGGSAVVLCGCVEAERGSRSRRRTIWDWSTRPPAISARRGARSWRPAMRPQRSSISASCTWDKKITSPLRARSEGRNQSASRLHGGQGSCTYNAAAPDDRPRLTDYSWLY